MNVQLSVKPREVLISNPRNPPSTLFSIFVISFLVPYLSEAVTQLESKYKQSYHDFDFDINIIKFF